MTGETSVRTYRRQGTGGTTGGMNYELVHQHEVLPVDRELVEVKAVECPFQEEQEKGVP